MKLDMILKRFEDKMPMYASVTNDFTNDISGKFQGDTVFIEKEPRYKATSGLSYSGQTIKKEKVDLVVDTTFTVGVDLGALDLTLDQNRAKFDSVVANPAGLALAREVEQDLNGKYVDVPNYVGTAGTTPSTFDNFYDPITALNILSVPMENRTLMLGPQEEQKFKGLNATYNSDLIVNEAVRTHALGEWQGTTVLRNPYRPIHTAGEADANYVANGATQGGDGNIIVQTGTGTLVVGDVVSFANTNSWSPERNETTAIVKDLVVDTAYAGGAGTISTAENLIADSTNAYRNVDQLVADTSAMTLIATHKVNMCFHKTAFAAAVVPLADIPAAAIRFTRTFNNISMTYAEWYDGNTEKQFTKLMILYGTKTIDPNAAVRLGG
jgi:hypothetical protein